MLRNIDTSRQRLILLALLPTVLLAAQAVQQQANPVHIALAVFCLVALLVAIIFVRQSMDEAHRFAIGERILLAAVLSLISDVGIGLLFSRLGRPIYPTGVFAVAGLILFLITGILAVRREPAALPVIVNRYRILAQMGAPLAYLLLLPSAVAVDGAVSLPYRTILSVLAVGLIVLAYGFLFQQALQDWQRDRPTSARAVSAWILMAGLLALQPPQPAWPELARRGWEAATPWWMLAHYGRLPFIDLQPAHGLIDYLPGLLAWPVGGDILPALAQTMPYLSAVLLLPVFLGVRRALGSLTAFLVIASAWGVLGSPVSAVLLCAAGLSVIFWTAQNKSAVVALWTWLVLSLALVLLSPAEGGSFVLATVPLACVLVCMVYQSCRWRLMPLAVLLGASVLAAYAFDPVRNVFTAIGERLLTASGFYALSTGLPAAPHAPLSIAGWALVLVVFLAVGMQITGFGQRLFSDDNARDLHRIVLLAAGGMLLFLLFRAVGAIDPEETPARGSVLLAFAIFALPWVGLPPSQKTALREWFLLDCAFLFGLAGVQSQQIASAWNAASASLDKPAVMMALDAQQAARVQEIQQVLNGLLDAQETYFDTTNHPEDYVLLGRANPAPYLSFTSTPDSLRQLRTIRALEMNLPPLVLLGGENRLVNGESLSMRSFWLYSYLLQRYVPFVDQFGRIWMARSDQRDRLQVAGYSVAEAEPQIALLQQAFHHADLPDGSLSWMGTAGLQQNRLRRPVDLLQTGRPLLPSSGLRAMGPTAWEVLEDGASITFDVPAGAHGDVLLLETAAPVTGGPWQITWTSDLVADFGADDSQFSFQLQGKRALIPLASAPSYLLSQNIRQIRIDFGSAYRGQIVLTRATLYDLETP